MRQLDLFGTLSENPAVEKQPEEKQVVLKKVEEHVSFVSATEKISYSLVEIAEEMSVAETFTQPDKNTIIQELNIEHPELKPDVLLPAGDLKHNRPDVPEYERTGAVIFDDGKIAVKVKNKHLVADPVIKEKVKKEPQKRGRKSLQEIEAEADLIEVPDDEVLFQKQYYSISEVAKWFRVNTSLLRFWENQFEILKPKKNRKGDRLFRPEDIKNLQLIYQLLRERKYTIEGAKEYIKTNRKKADIQLQVTNTLQKFKSFLLDLKSNLQS